MVGIFDCGGVLGKYEIRLKERKVVNMEALNTYKTEKTLAEQMNERLAEMKMTKGKAQTVSVPVIEESPVNIECKVTQVIELGSHDMFLAEVTAVLADEKYMDETGKFDLNKTDLIAYSHGQYFTLGDYVGKFGYSVQKKK